MPRRRFGRDEDDPGQLYIDWVTRIDRPKTEASAVLPTTPAIPRSHTARRIIARFPVPRPLPSAVAACHFGQDNDGKPVRPGACEVREITEHHADKLIELLDAIASAPANGDDPLKAQFNDGITAYAEDFGEHAARQLEAYVRHQARLDSDRRRGR